MGSSVLVDIPRRDQSDEGDGVVFWKIMLWGRWDREAAPWRPLQLGKRKAYIRLNLENSATLSSASEVQVI